MENEKTVDEIVEQNKAKMRKWINHPLAITHYATRVDGGTGMAVIYNHLTGIIGMHGDEPEEGVVSNDDPRYFSRANISYNYNDSSKPYKIDSVWRLGPEEQFVFGMVPGDKVIERTFAELSAERKR